MKHYLIGVPFALLVALLAPFAILLAPVILVGSLGMRVDPVETFRTLWRILAALRGTHVEFTEQDRLFEIRIG